MKTRIIKIDSKNISTAKINEAARIIKKGGVVAFPTETVYGLGANGLDKKAVRKIFLAKGRPQDNPLILHVSGIDQVNYLVNKTPEKAAKLMERFWPGPLTLVMKKSKAVPKAVTAGLDSVAIRMPKNKISLELIKESGCPLAAPSANISGKPSPTLAEHVIDDLNGRIDAVIDGGKVDIGIESTVLDMTQEIPQILRLGKITKKQIEKVIGRVNDKNISDNKPRSPGMKYRHYSPNAQVILVKSNKESKLISEKHSKKKIRILKYENEIKMAKNLFKDFRESDKEGYDIIIVFEPKGKEFGSAILDRLKKASK